MSEQPFSNALFADLYELTMAQAYWQHGWQAEATFSMFFREYPPDRGYLVYAGLEDLLDYLDAFRFEERDIEYLRTSDRFDDAFVTWLADLRFTGSVRSMVDGEIFLADEPVVEVTGPVIEAQLVETYLMNQINLQTTLATKAARVMHASQGRQMVEFVARRAQGTDAANKLARVCCLTGFAGTSNMQASALYGMPPRGHDDPLVHHEFSLRARGFRGLRRFLSGHDDLACRHLRHHPRHAQRHRIRPGARTARPSPALDPTRLRRPTYAIYRMPSDA
jgi:nicotinate phosphoribosyltransferase